MATQSLNRTHLKEVVKKLPSTPGVYLFKDASGVIIYIGKAKNLKSRCSSYVKETNITIKTANLMREAAELSHIQTGDELEAMLLEATLIQEHKPRYNVLLRDGQPFLYFLITRGKFPKLELVRNTKRGGTYFGPFIDKTNMRSIHTKLLKTFRLKICGKKMVNGCLYYHMGACSGSCREDFDLPGYLQRLEMVKTFFKKGKGALITDLKHRIEEHSQKLEFEKALGLKTLLDAIHELSGQLVSSKSAQSVIASHQHMEIWYFDQQHERLFLFTELQATLKQRQMFLIPEETCSEDFFTEFYRNNAPAPVIITNIEFENLKLTNDFLNHWWPKRELPTNVMNPTSGHYFQLLKLAEVSAEKYHEKYGKSAQYLQILLKLPKPPHTIDCFDVSHKQGHNIVASCIRFVDGLPDKNMFRKFKINSLDEQNDYAALQEAVQRRYEKNHDYPDLIFVDGGKGQLSAVRKIVPSHIECASIAKREEQIFSSRINGKRLDPDKVAAQTLLALRDYAHHFAITYHRELDLKEKTNPEKTS